MLDIIFSYEFLVLASGTSILAIATGMVGSISVLKNQSLIGDSISHSTYPGIILAFVLFQTRNPIVLSIGALITGSIAFFMIQALHEYSKVSLDTIMAIILATMFGLGMSLKTYIDSAKFTTASQAGLSDYIFGQAAYTMVKDVYMIIVVAIISIGLLLLFYKEIKLFIFDSIYAATIGIKSSLIYGLILIMSMVLISVGIKIVGAVLISSMLIAPSVTGLMWSNKFEKVLFISALSGGISAIIGSYLSLAIRGFSTGPTIIVVMTLIATFSILFSNNGLIINYIRRKNNRKLLMSKDWSDKND